NLSAQKNIVAHAQEKISLFAAQKGLRAFAAKGKVEIQAQDDAIEVIARKVIKLISTEEKIEITSPKEIVLTAGGSQIKINAQGVFTTTGGKFESKAGQHSFVGGATVNAELPNIPTNKNYSNKLDLYHLFVGEKFLNIEYQYLDKNTNTYITGNLDEDGQTQDYFSDVQKEFDILVGYNSSEWLSDDDLSFDHVEEKDI
ncbi:MAG: DUF2345 domain-containing protein, partial [Acinetobacter sp.]